MPKSNEFTPMFDDLPTHRKTRAFRAITGWDLFPTMGFLYMFWRQVGKDSPYGVLAGLAHPESVLEAIGCRKEKIPEIVDALLKSEWIDRSENEGEFIVHDWADGAGKFTIKKEKDRLRKQAERENKRLTESVHGQGADSLRTDDGQATDSPEGVRDKEKKGKEKKETPPLPPASGGRCADDLNSFEASFSETREVVLDAWKAECAKAPRGFALDANTREGARILASAIDLGQLPRELLAGTLRNGLADKNLPNQGLRGIAQNYSKYMPAKPVAEKDAKKRVRVWCDSCGVEEVLLLTPAEATKYPQPCGRMLSVTDECIGTKHAEVLA